MFPFSISLILAILSFSLTVGSELLNFIEHMRQQNFCDFTFVLKTDEHSLHVLQKGSRDSFFLTFSLISVRLRLVE